MLWIIGDSDSINPWVMHMLGDKHFRCFALFLRVVIIQTGLDLSQKKKKNTAKLYNNDFKWKTAVDSMCGDF